LGNTLRGLCALADPVLVTVSINTDAFSIAASHRIEEPDTLNKAAITGAATISHNHLIERTLLGAATGQADLEGHGFLFLWSWS